MINKIDTPYKSSIGDCPTEQMVAIKTIKLETKPDTGETKAPI